MNNRLFHGYCNNNGNTKSKISKFVVCTVRAISDYNGGQIIEEVKTLQEFFNNDGLGRSKPYYKVIGILNDDFGSQTWLFDSDELEDCIYAVEYISGNTIIET